MEEDADALSLQGLNVWEEEVEQLQVRTELTRMM